MSQIDDRSDTSRRLQIALASEVVQRLQADGKLKKTKENIKLVETLQHKLRDADADPSKAEPRFFDVDMELNVEKLCFPDQLRHVHRVPESAALFLGLSSFITGPHIDAPQSTLVAGDIDAPQQTLRAGALIFFLIGSAKVQLGYGLQQQYINLTMNGGIGTCLNIPPSTTHAFTNSYLTLKVAVAYTTTVRSHCIANMTSPYVGVLGSGTQCLCVQVNID